MNRPSALRSVPGSFRVPAASRAAAAAKTPALTAGMVAVLVYLWVIHSQKLPLSQPAILLGLLALAAQREPIRLARPLVWFGAFVAWSFLGAFASPDRATAFQGSWDYLKLWLIFLVTSNAAHTPRQLRTFIIAWLGLYALYPVRGTLFNLFAGISTFNRYAWNFIFRNPNDLATLTLPIFALSAALAWTERGWVRMAAVVGTIVLPTIIIATQSRAGIVAFAVMVVLILREVWRAKVSKARHADDRLRRRSGTLVALAFVAAVGVALFAPSGVWDRLRGLQGVSHTERLAEVDPEGSAEQRYEIWKVSWAIAGDNLLFGAGAGNYANVHAQYASQGSFKRTARGTRDTHSTYLNTLAENGIIGLLLLLAMLGATFRGTLLAERHMTAVPGQLRIMRIGLLAFLVSSIFATMQHVAFLYLYIALITIASSLTDTQSAAEGEVRTRRRTR